MGKHLPQMHKDLGSIPRIKISERIYFKQFPSLLPKCPPLFQASPLSLHLPHRGTSPLLSLPFVSGPPPGCQSLG